MGDILDLYEMIKDLEERMKLIEGEDEDIEDEFNTQDLEDDTDPLLSNDDTKLDVKL